MKNFITFTSQVVPLPIKDVDTDMIIPAQRLTRIEKTGYGQFLFEHLRAMDANFPLHQVRYQGAQILLSESNFGCGSSREHAVWAIQQAGFKTVIAMSFSDIFFNNAAKNGLLLIALPEAVVRQWLQQERIDLTVDLAQQIVTSDAGETHHFDYDPFIKQCLLEGLDDLDYLLAAVKGANLMQKNIAILAGDGIGPEVMMQAQRVLNAIAEKCHHQFIYHEALIGGAAFDAYGTHFPDETLKICQRADAILFGSVGGPVSKQHLNKWRDCETNSLLSLRKIFQFSTNIRPAHVYPVLQVICPLKKSIIANGIDVIIFRELLGDLYFGRHVTKTVGGVRQAEDQALYNEKQIGAILHPAFKAAQQRKGILHSIDKANVLDTSKLWRVVANEVAADYPDVKLQHMLVDNCAMQLIINPGQFDVIVTSNMFGDILSDAAAVLPGSLGLMPSVSLNAEGFGLFEPSGGSAPDIIGQDKANPIAQILSAALLLRYSFGLTEEATAIKIAVEQALAQGARTQDIANKSDVAIGTVAMTDKILSFI